MHIYKTIHTHTHTQEKQTLLLFTADRLHKTLIQKAKFFFKFLFPS